MDQSRIEKLLGPSAAAEFQRLISEYPSNTKCVWDSFSAGFSLQLDSDKVSLNHADVLVDEISEEGYGQG